MWLVLLKDSCTCGFPYSPSEIQRPCRSWSLSPRLVPLSLDHSFMVTSHFFPFPEPPDSPVSGSALVHPVCSFSFRSSWVPSCVLSTAARGRWPRSHPPRGSPPSQWGCKPAPLREIPEALRSPASGPSAHPAPAHIAPCHSRFLDVLPLPDVCLCSPSTCTGGCLPQCLSYYCASRS